MNNYIGISDAAFQKEIKQLNQKELEELYLEAKDEYYSGSPKLSDHQFDMIEFFLKEVKSVVVDIVGGNETEDVRKLKHKHWSPMLSLDKQQVNDENNFPQTELEHWAKNKFPIEATAKYDGNAIELQYDNGKLQLAVTRGKNGKGQDVTNKLIYMVPSIVDFKDKMEIRGEVVMSNDIFNSKWLPTGKKHPRNTIAGLLNTDTVLPEDLEGCYFVAYSLKRHNDLGFEYVTDAMYALYAFKFNREYNPPIFTINSNEDFRKAYDFFKNYRANETKFTLDGIVLKMKEDIRESMGETSHHPKWGISVKFPSKEAQTKILSIIWESGYTGEFTPVGILSPVDLDGSIITRASLYNKNKIEELRTFPGAVVNIKRSGDIIPMITEVVTPSPDAEKYIKEQSYFPSVCPSCTEDLHFETIGKSESIHIMCKNDDCPSQNIKKFANGITALEIKGIGESIAENLYYSGIENLIDFFDLKKMNEENLIRSGLFKKGKALDNILECVHQLREVDLFKAIHAMQFKSVGAGTSKEIAKMIANVDYSFSGKEKAAWEPFTNENSPQSKKLKIFLSVLKANKINIIYPLKTIKNMETTINFEMTGNTKNTDYKTKDELTKFLAPKGYVHTALKDASLLLTDSHTSSSSKMATAKKKGITIMTYEELLDSLK